jgi:uncharacterized damage-inducible protein DinB
MKAHFILMAEYNAWANRRLYHMANQLPDELYRKDVGAYFKSMHGTLNHLLTADRIWLRRLTGTGENPTQLDAILCDDLASLTDARIQEDARIVQLVQSLEPAELDEPFAFRMRNGTPNQLERGEVLAHLFNHQTHHRGQAHTILTVLGVSEPDSLDLLVLLRERQASRAALP